MNLLNVLNAVSQAVMYPVIVTLLLLVVLTVVLLVMTVVEYFTERRLFKVSVPAFLRQIEESSCQQLPGVIARAEIIKRQKLALMALFNARDLPEEARWNIAKRSVFEAGRRYDRITAIAELTAKVAPMIGLMGTLIPLGPGIDALSKGDMAMLAQSLLVAFNTTVVGLLSAVLCLLVAKVRRRWNADYNNALETMESTLFDRIAELEEIGDLEYSAPMTLVADDGKEANTEEGEVGAKEAAPEDGEAGAQDGEAVGDGQA
ncbi:MAG: MotA/TolQ/ExbB proton channel family protein [Eggerthellaceae bacterium]|nr:MotA/TolQ/ExbB proton channel family protein [Eggerthellaceae bacterium]